MSFLKNGLSIILVLCLAVMVSGCGNKNNDESGFTVPTNTISFEVENDNKLINSADTYEAKENGFNFNVNTEDNKLINSVDTYEAKENSINFNIDTEAPKISAPEPVKVSEAKIDFKVESFDFDFSTNVYEAQLVEFGKLTNEEKALLIEKKESFLSELLFAFQKYNIDVKIDAVSGEIVLDSTVLFDTDKYEVTEKGKEILATFIQAYTSVACDEKYEDFISKILIEGHTDTAGSYSYNKTLSEKRANNVMEYCLSDDAPIDDVIRAKFGKMVKAVGCSYDRPIMDASDKINMAASRRVTFRFLINI